MVIDIQRRLHMRKALLDIAKAAAQHMCLTEAWRTPTMPAPSFRQFHMACALVYGIPLEAIYKTLQDGLETFVDVDWKDDGAKVSLAVAPVGSIVNCLVCGDITL
jgi:hypothetical protein